MRKINANDSKTWHRDRERMIYRIQQHDDSSERPTIELLKAFKKYSDGTKAALLANYTRGAYETED